MTTNSSIKVISGQVRELTIIGKTNSDMLHGACKALAHTQFQNAQLLDITYSPPCHRSVSWSSIGAFVPALKILYTLSLTNE